MTKEKHDHDADGGEGIANKWEKHFDESSQTPYYYNPHTGESSWDVPEGYESGKETAAIAPSNQQPAKWRKFVDEASGKAYYYDEVNDLTQWEEPEGFAEEQQSDQEEDRNVSDDQHTDEKSADDSKDAPEADKSVEVQVEDSDENESTIAKAKATEPVVEVSIEKHQWVKHVDLSTGKPYYHDRVSGKTQWEQPEHFAEVSSSVNPASSEYQAYLNRVRTERLARVTQQVLDPTGNIGRLNAILSGIDGNKTRQSVDNEDETTKAEWQQHVDPQTQRFYYHNVVAGVTQWQKPDAPIVSGLADWIPPELPDPAQDQERSKTVTGVNYVAKAKFNRLTGKYEQLGGEDYWQSVGSAPDREGRQMSHFFDMNELEKNREEAKLKKELLKRKNIDWKKIAAEKKAKKMKQKNEWLYQD